MIRRRDFLKGTSLAALVAGRPSTCQAEGAGTQPPAGRTFDRAQWETIATVHDHLLPSEPDAPGARDLNTTAYLDRTLADPKFDPDIKGFILKGIGWLNEISREEDGLPFHQVAPARREDLLRQIDRSAAGERWLSTLISYCLEAMLADPLYGGNPQGIGWKWLEHQPGQPRPTPEKIYGRLGKS